MQMMVGEKSLMLDLLARDMWAAKRPVGDCLLCELFADDYQAGRPIAGNYAARLAGMLNALDGRIDPGALDEWRRELLAAQHTEVTTDETHST